MFPSVEFPFEYWMLPSDSFVSCLDSLLGYFAGESQALQLTVFAMFGALNKPLASCILVQFLEIKFVTFSSLLIMFYIYRKASQWDNILFSFTLFSCL